MPKKNEKSKNHWQRDPVTNRLRFCPPLKKKVEVKHVEPPNPKK